MTSSIIYESPDSSSPLVTRGVSAGLQNRYCQNYQLAGWQKFFLNALGYLPNKIAGQIVMRFQGWSSLDPELIRDLDIGQVIDQRLNDYTQLIDTFPAIVVGSALGGATTHLSLSLNAPFLPQAYVFTMRGGTSSGSVLEYFQRSARLANSLTMRNSGIVTIQHFDPIHDGWITRFANHLRFKLIDLPERYISFIQRSLKPGGAIVYLDCGANWLRYRTGERNYFQVGGWGGLSAEEYLSPDEQIIKYVHSTGMKEYDWRLKDFPLEVGRESEWGSEPGLGDSLAEFCHRNGYEYIQISLPQPHDFSTLAFRAVSHLLSKQETPPRAVSIEMFSQFDGTAVRRGGLLPLWLVFNTKDSLDYLTNMCVFFPQESKVFFSLLATFSNTPDLVSWEEWNNALAGFNWTNSGARADHYPADAHALTSWDKPVRDWVENNPAPIRSWLTIEELNGLVHDLKSGKI